MLNQIRPLTYSEYKLHFLEDILYRNEISLYNQFNRNRRVKAKADYIFAELDKLSERLRKLKEEDLKPF